MERKDQTTKKASKLRTNERASERNKQQTNKQTKNMEGKKNHLAQTRGKYLRTGNGEQALKIGSGYGVVWLDSRGRGTKSLPATGLRSHEKALADAGGIPKAPALGLKG